MCKPEAVEPVPGLGLCFMFILFKFRILLACNDLKLGLGSFSSTSWESEHFTSGDLAVFSLSIGFPHYGKISLCITVCQIWGFLSRMFLDFCFWRRLSFLLPYSAFRDLFMPWRLGEDSQKILSVSCPISSLESFHPLPHTWASGAGGRFSVLTLNIDRFVQTHSMTEVLWGSKYSDWLTLLLKLW